LSEETTCVSENGRKIAGVMGGMGPDATVDFMAKITAMADSGRDQDHVHLIVDQDPTVPNRQEAIRTGVDDVSPHLAAMAQRLENAGADFLVMVCNTAHVFLDGVRETTRIPFISIIDESIAEVDRLRPEATAVGLMATDGCLNTNIYQDAVLASGRTPVVPDEAGVAELMRLITAIKAGDQSKAIADGMEAVALELVERGADVIIAGCTEIPIVFTGENLALPVISSTDVLARRTLSLAQGMEPLPGTPN
jgi:aspartate racemase